MVSYVENCVAAGGKCDGTNVVECQSRAVAKTNNLIVQRVGQTLINDAYWGGRSIQNNVMSGRRSAGKFTNSHVCVTLKFGLILINY